MNSRSSPPLPVPESPAPTLHAREATGPQGASLAWVAVVLAVVVAGLRVVLSRPLTFCGTPDACYYLGMAQNLAEGRGFHARFLYDFQQAHPTLPNTGIEYWRPGISLLLLLLRPLGGVTLHASIVLTTLVGVLFSAAAWHIAAQTTQDRRVALGAFALCLLSSSTWIGSASPDSGLYYGAAVAWFLALFTVRRQGLLQDVLALLCVALAYLIRNDAAMLLIPLVVVLWRRRSIQRFAGPGVEANPAKPGSSVPYAVAMLAGFVLALAPMHLLYLRVLGTAFPSGTAQALYLNDLSDFGRYGDPVSVHSLLAHGIRHLLLFRAATLATVLYRIAVLMIGYPALVFLAVLFPWSSADNTPARAPSATHRLPECTGALAFGLVTLLAYTLVLPAIGGFSALRTAVGLMPLVSVLVMIAIGRAARTQRLATWLAAGVVGANALAGLMEVRRDLPAANGIGVVDRSEAAALAALGANPATAIVLTNDPVQFAVTTGFSTVVLPSNGLDAIVHAARDFHVTHVILDTDNLPAAPADLERRLQPLRSATLAREHSLVLELPQTHPER